MTTRAVEVHELSLPSLRVSVLASGSRLGTATGFVVEASSDPYLITNKHVVTGVDPGTGQALTPGNPAPDTLMIHHHAAGQLGSWVGDRVPLFDANREQRWLEHASQPAIDVVALPLESNPALHIFPFPLALADVDAVPEPAMPVSIIGFPMGIAVGDLLPIWKTGHIASDPAVDFDGKPSFLIDATTRGGMSGSPVVLKTQGGYRTSDGRRPMRDITKFLGVYSGRIRSDIEIGIVWKPDVIEEIIGIG